MNYSAETLQVRPLWHGEGSGLFARQDIERGELLIVWGGRVMTTAEVVQLGNSDYSVQVDEDLHLVTPLTELSDGDFINHGCDPNVVLLSQISLVAARRIRADEEVVYDYAMSDSSHLYEFPCYCASRLCRGRVTRNDWLLPDLQRRYRGHFAPYLQRRIDALVRRKSQLSNTHKGKERVLSAAATT